MEELEAFVRRYYAARLEQAHREGTELWAVFGGEDRDAIPDSMPDTPERRAAFPPAVLEAFDFYDTNVMEEDWGSVGAYRVDAGGPATFAVFARDDGGRCWLEVFDEAGGLLGAARSAEGRTAWLPREAIREGVFSDDFRWMLP